MSASDAMALQPAHQAAGIIAQRTIRFESTIKVLAKRAFQYYRISWSPELEQLLVNVAKLILGGIASLENSLLEPHEETSSENKEKRHIHRGAALRP